MKRVMLATVLVFVFAAVAAAGDLTLGIMGNDDQLEPRIGWRPLERTEIGVFALWEDFDDAIGAGFYASYDVVQTGEFDIFGLVNVPATIFVGASVGAVDLPDADAVARLETGLLFGDEKIQIGPVYQYALDESLWSDLGTPPDQHLLLICLKVNF